METYLNKVENTKKWVLSKYPEAKIIGVGSNNLVTGVWYQKPNNNLRTFTPLF
jgi:hypothetical protein